MKQTSNICFIQYRDLGKFCILTNLCVGYGMGFMYKLMQCALIKTLFVCLFVFHSSPTYFIAAPNVIRVGVNETIMTHILGDIDSEVTVPVTIELKDHPAGNIVYDNKTIDVSKSINVLVLKRSFSFCFCFISTLQKHLF